MAKDTTQLILDFQQNQKKVSLHDDFENATPLILDIDKGWVDEPLIFSKQSGDLTGAIDIEENVLGDGRPELHIKNSEEIPTPKKIPEGVWEIIESGRNIGWEAVIRAGVGATVAKGELSVEKGLETANEELLKQQAKNKDLENINFMKHPFQAILQELSTLSVFQEQIIKEAAIHALAFGNIAMIMTVMSGGATAPLIPLAMAAGGTYGVIKKSMDIEGMNLYMDMLEKGIDTATALPLALAAGIAIGYTELFQLKLFTHGFTGKFLKALSTRKVQNVMVEMAMLWSKTSGLEVAQELVQEAIGIGTKFMAAMIEGNPDAVPTWDEMKEGFGQILSARFIASMAVLAVPSTVSGGVQVAKLKKIQAFKEENKRLDEVIEKIKEVKEKRVEKTTELEVEAFEKTGGSTFKNGQNLIGTENFVVSIFPDDDIGVQFTGKLDSKTLARELKAFKEEHAEILKDPNVTVGTFYSEDLNTTDIDIVAIIPHEKRAEAIQLAKEFDQESIFDLKELKIIKTGDVGKAIPKEQFATIEERLEMLEDIVKETKAVKQRPKKPREKIVTKEMKEEKKRADRVLWATHVKEKAKAFARGIREGKRVSAKEIRSIQDEIAAVITASEATDKVKRDTLKFMRTVQTEKQFQKAFPKILERLEKSTEGFKKRVIIEKFKKLTKAKVVRELQPELRDQVQSILSQYTAVELRAETTKKLQALAQQLRENENNELTEEQINALGALNKKSLRKLSLEDLQLIHDSVAHIVWLNTAINKAVEQERTQTDVENVDEAANNIKKRFGELEDSVEGLDALQIEEEAKLLTGVGVVKDIAGVGSYNMELIGEILDGQDNGIIQRVMYREIDIGEAKSLRYKHEAEDYFIKHGIRDILKDDSWSTFFSRKAKNVKKFKIRLDSGKIISITRGDRIAFILHSRNENSRRHLLEGGFVLRKSPTAKVKKLTENDLAQIVESATEQEQKVADVISIYFNTIQKDAINENSVKLLGFEVAIEPNYFSIRVSRLALRITERLQTLVNTNSFIKTTLEGMGIFIRRVKSTEPIVITDAFEVTHDNIQKVAAYIGLAAPLRKAKALFNAPKFKAAMVNAGRKKYLDSIEDYLSRVEGDSIRNDSWDKLTQEWINKLDVAILGGNVGVFFKQPVSYFLASTEMDTKYILESFRPIVSKELKTEIKKWSPHFRDRFEGNVTRELGEIASVGRTRRFFTGRDVISKKLMIGIRTFDTMAIAGIWRAVKKEVADQLPSLEVGSNEFMQKVADRAWEVARRTQPTFSIKDRSTIGRRQSIFWRLATKYTSQRNKNWMIQRRAVEQWNRSEKTASDLTKLVKRIIAIRFVAPAMIAGVNAIRGLGRDDVDDEEHTLLRRFLSDWLATTIGDVYIISNILQGAITQITEGRKGFGMTDPLTAHWAEMSTTLANYIKGIGLTMGLPHIKNRRDWEKRKHELVWEMIKDTSSLISKIKGIPFESARRSLELTGKATGILDKKEDTKKRKRNIF